MKDESQAGKKFYALPKKEMIRTWIKALPQKLEGKLDYM